MTFSFRFFFFTALVPYEQVVAELAADTLDQISSLGLKGMRFMPEEFSQLACVSLKVEHSVLFKGCPSLLPGTHKQTLILGLTLILHQSANYLECHHITFFFPTNLFQTKNRPLTIPWLTFALNVYYLNYGIDACSRNCAKTKK